jgi:hypothetical protein
MGETCLKRRCYSPIACEGWGYCRELNLITDPIDKDGIRPASLIEERRRAALSASTASEGNADGN